MATLINNPRHWRERAEEARAHAEQMADAEARHTMLLISAGYDRLADRAEQRLRGSEKSK
jgi:hypothetical protein